MDVHEDREGNSVTATFELPGLKKEDVHIDVHNNVLTVSGENKIDEQRTQDGYAVRERRFGRFTRSLPLPQGIKVRADSSYLLGIRIMTNLIRRSKSRRRLRMVFLPSHSQNLFPSLRRRRSQFRKRLLHMK
jgi:hypothetical protein